MDRTRHALIAALAIAAVPAFAQDGFDACEVFTQAEADKALGAGAEPEPVNPKVKRPKVVSACTYYSSKDGKSRSAVASFRFGRSDDDARRAFEDERLRFQTKPMLIGGGSGFWSAKQGQVHVLKGRTWLTVAVGGAKPAERDADASRKLAEAIAKKL